MVWQCIGQGFDGSLWPRGTCTVHVGHLNYLAVLGAGIFEFLFVPVATNHFPGWGISVIFDLTFFPKVGNFTAIFWKMSNPYI